MRESTVCIPYLTLMLIINVLDLSTQQGGYVRTTNLYYYY